MESLEETISSRRQRIDSQIVGKTVENYESNLINRECLLDALQALYDECSVETLQKYDKYIAQFVERYKSIMLQLKRLRVNITDFEIKNVIGRGHFGEVHVVKEKQTGDIYAMKTIRKCDSLEKTSYDVERDIMAFAQSPWITSLQYAFQDSIYLFFVMEFHPGGDLLGLLCRQGGTLPESAATFYIAELVLALEYLHAMGYVHRDIKPENVLLDQCGHLKLVDFGSAAKLNSQGFVVKGIPVGTPDYVAPEVLRSVETKNSKQSGYGVSCDYWSLGVLAYELTVGKSPFVGQNTATTYSRIMNYSNNLKFPSDVLLTQAYISFIKDLLTDEKSRLNQQLIKQHILFKNLHWDSLRDQVPPYVPKISSIDDTSNFTDVIVKKTGPSIENFKKKTQFSGRNLPFIGFTFTQCLQTCEASYSKSTKDEIILNMKQELENMRNHLMKTEGFEVIKLNLEKKIVEKCQKLENIESVRNKLERDLAGSIAENTALRRTLEIERKDRTELERKALDLIKSAKTKWEISERNKVESLRLEIEQQKEQIMQLSTTNNMLNEQLQRAFKLENKHKESLEAVEQLTRRSVAGLESKLEKVAQNSKNKITNLQTTLDEEIHQKQLLQVELKNSKDNAGKLLKELEKSREDYMILSHKACEADMFVKTLSQKVSDLEINMDKAENFKAEVLDLTQKLNACQENIRDLEKRNLLLEEENNNTDVYKGEITTLKAIKAQNEKKIDELESKLHEEEITCSSLKKQLQDSEILINESQQLKELRMKMWKMEKEFGNCKIDKRIVERELKNTESRVKELNEEINKLTQKIEENSKIHKSALLELNTINENLSLELIKFKESCRHLEEQVQSERMKYVAEKNVVARLNDVLNAKDLTVLGLNEKIHELKNELLSIRNRYGLAEKETHNIMEEFKVVKNENVHLNRELLDAKRQLENTQINLEALREACTIIENQVIEYENINSSIQAEKSSLAENTEKLIRDLCKAKEDIQEAKKLANEEKSARLMSETKIKRLTEDIECLQNECASYKDQCLKYRECSSNLSDELTITEEKVSSLAVTVKSYERQIEQIVSENNLLKEEISQYLTQIADLKESNFNLKQQVQDLNSTKKILTQRIDELEVLLSDKINYYEERELKHNSTIKQQTKLIDYLQVKIDENSQKKKTLTDKLFGYSKKENQIPVALPMNYKDLEGQLQKQRQVNKDLQEELYKLKAELNCKTNAEIARVGKLDRHKSEIVSPQTKFAMEQLVKSSDSSKTELFTHSSLQRMYHNIPHRFVIKLSKRITKCDFCSKQIMHGRDISVCRECSVSVHPDCSRSLKATCGLPRAYAEHFRDDLNKLNLCMQNEGDSDAPVNMEGWIKVLSKNGSWEKRYASLTDFYFNIYANSTKDSVVKSVELNVQNCKKTVTLEPVPSEIGVNVASSDLPFVLKLEISTDSTCWPPVSVIFLTLSTADRDKWFRALRKLFNEGTSKYHAEPIVTIPEHLYINCVLDITKNIKVFGAAQGLYSYCNNLLLHIEGLTEVHQICIVPETNTVVMISGSTSILISCDLHHLINLTQCAPCTKPMLTYKEIVLKNLDGFHFLQASNIAKHQMFCAATSKQLVIAKFDLEANFVPLRIMDTAEPVGCILFTEHTLIVGADKFFEIDLCSFTAEEFLDSSDLNLMRTVKCHKMQSFPLAIMKIFDDPIEYLLCYNEFAVFVDQYGRSSRTTEIKSSYLPIGFQFIKPYLYIIQFSGIEILKLSEDILKTENSLSHINSINIELKRMRCVGYNKLGLYVCHDNKIKLFEGKKLVDFNSISLISQYTDNDDESDDRFSFTSSIVQSLDGNLSDAENSSVEIGNIKE